MISTASIVDVDVLSVAKIRTSSEFLSDVPGWEGGAGRYVKGGFKATALTYDSDSVSRSIYALWSLVEDYGVAIDDLRFVQSESLGENAWEIFQTKDTSDSRSLVAISENRLNSIFVIIRRTDRDIKSSEPPFEEVKNEFYDFLSKLPKPQLPE